LPPEYVLHKKTETILSKTEARNLHCALRSFARVSDIHQGCGEFFIKIEPGGHLNGTSSPMGMPSPVFGAAEEIICPLTYKLFIEDIEMILNNIVIINNANSKMLIGCVIKEHYFTLIFIGCY
jgi:hypothetical protein